MAWSVPHWISKPHRAPDVEDGVPLRAWVFANTAFACLGYGTVDPDTPILLPILLAGAGMAFSHRFRHRANYAVKWVLAVGMIAALWIALDNLVRGTIDARLALAQLLLWLQVLNAFDLPRRRNLRIALLVSAILTLVTATLSRTMDFGAIFVAFGLSLILAEYAGFRSEIGASVARPWRAAGVTAAIMGGVLVLGLPLFIAAPRQERDLAVQTLPMSFRLPLPDNLDSRVRRPGLASSSQAGRRDSDRTGVQDFSERLDLDARPAPSEEIVMRVKSSRPQYWRAMAFDRYDGRTWRMSAPETVESVTVESEMIKLTRPRGQASGQPLVQTFYVERDLGNLIFAAWTPSALYFPTSLVWRDSYGSLRSPLMLEKEMYYSVVSETPVYERTALARRYKAAPPARLAGYLKLPAMSDRTRALVSELTALVPTPYLKVQALSHYLQGAYPYRLDLPKAPAGREWVDYFLFEQRAGYCEQFATSLAAMGRLAGVPTRLVTGYVPGDYNPFTGFYEVKGKHAHAWVEAWIPGVGWIPFDATPGSVASMWDTPEGARKPGLHEAIVAYAGAWIASNRSALLGVLGLAGLAGLALVARARRANAALAPATRHYRRLRRRLARRGVPALPGDTPRAWLARALAVPAIAPAAPALEAFVAGYEAARFGAEPIPIEPLAEAAEAAIRRA